MVGGVIREPRGAAASRRFTKALVDLAAQGLRTHCSDPGLGDLWISESEPERAEAARLCAGCPVIIECWSVGAERRERWGVWGGIDRSQHPNGKPVGTSA
jgi:hypothetical protein